MKRQIQAIGMLHIVEGFIIGCLAFGCLLISAVIFLFAMNATGSPKESAESARTAILAGSAVWVGFAAALGGFAWFLVALGNALRSGRPWARTAGMVLSIFRLWNFPVHTLTGAWTLSVLTDPEAIEWFAAGSPSTRAGSIDRARPGALAA